MIDNRDFGNFLAKKWGTEPKNLKNESVGRVRKEESGEEILGKDRANDERKGRDRKTKIDKK
jgi:hypothetical protein